MSNDVKSAPAAAAPPSGPKSKSVPNEYGSSFETVMRRSTDTFDGVKASEFLMGLEGVAPVVAKAAAIVHAAHNTVDRRSLLEAELALPYVQKRVLQAIVADHNGTLHIDKTLNSAFLRYFSGPSAWKTDELLDSGLIKNARDILEKMKAENPAPVGAARAVAPMPPPSADEKENAVYKALFDPLFSATTSPAIEELLAVEGVLLRTDFVGKEVFVEYCRRIDKEANRKRKAERAAYVTTPPATPAPVATAPAKQDEKKQPPPPLMVAAPAAAKAP
jgi:hypothetical protein